MANNTTVVNRWSQGLVDITTREPILRTMPKNRMNAILSMRATESANVGITFDKMGDAYVPASMVIHNGQKVVGQWASVAGKRQYCALYRIGSEVAIMLPESVLTGTGTAYASDGTAWHVIKGKLLPVTFATAQAQNPQANIKAGVNVDPMLLNAPAAPALTVAPAAPAPKVGARAYDVTPIGSMLHNALKGTLVAPVAPVAPVKARKPRK